MVKPLAEYQAILLLKIKVAKGCSSYILLDLLQPQDKTIVSININNPLVKAFVVEATLNIGQ